MPPVDDDRRLWRRVVAWCCAIATLYLVAAVVMGCYMSSRWLDAIERHIARVEAKSDVLPGADRLKVSSGIYLNRIPRLSRVDMNWMADFYIWFRWQGGEQKLNLGDSLRIVDGDIVSRREESYRRDGDRHYLLYRITARISKFFHVARFPRDDHLLSLQIEDGARDISKLEFVPDLEATGVSSNVAIPDYAYSSPILVAKQHAYRTSFGDLSRPVASLAHHSQLTFALPINRPAWGSYFKLFLGFFAATMMSLLAFLIPVHHTSPRFAVGVGAFFATVTSTYLIWQQNPQSSLIGLMDLVSAVSIVTILLSLLSSTIALWLHERHQRPALAYRFDRILLPIFLIGYGLVNVTVAVAANW